MIIISEADLGGDPEGPDPPLFVPSESPPPLYFQTRMKITVNPEINLLIN